MEPETTRSFLLSALLHGESTAQALAKQAGVDVAAARRHLESFVAEGVAEASFRQEGMGRPKKYYAITAAGRERFPRRYDLLLGSLVEATIRQQGRQGFARLMEGVAEDLARQYGGRIPRGAPLRARVEAVAACLREMGFPTEVEERGGKLHLVRRDCIFLRLAEAHPTEVCVHLDTAFLSRLLGEKVELAERIPAGDGLCRHELRVGRQG